MPRIYGNLQRERRDYGPLFKRIRKVMTYVAVLAVLYVFFFSSVFIVRRVEVQGAALADSATIESWIPKGGSIWRLDDTAIRARILAEQPVQKVTILKGLPDSIRVVVEEEAALILWKTNSTISLIDKGGIAFYQYPENALPATDTAAGKKVDGLLLIADNKNLPAKLGEQVVSANFVSFVQDLQKAMSKYVPGHTITNLSVDDTIYDLTAKTDKGMTIQLNTVADAAPQIRNLARLIEQKNIPQNAIVDLRIDRWAYVKNP